MNRSRGVRLVGMISVAVVAIVAAVVSYAHMQDVADKAGEGWRSYLEPLSVDGLLVGASLVLYVRRSARFAWVAVAVGILVSLAANLAAAHPSLISRLVSAWPAVALALSYETLLTLVRHVPENSTQDDSVADTFASGNEQDAESVTDEDNTDVLNGHDVVNDIDPYAWMNRNTTLERSN